MDKRTIPYDVFMEAENQHGEIESELRDRVAELEARSQVERRIDGVCTHVLHVGTNASCVAYINGVSKGIDVACAWAPDMSATIIMEIMRSLVIAAPDQSGKVES